MLISSQSIVGHFSSAPHLSQVHCCCARGLPSPPTVADVSDALPRLSGRAFALTLKPWRSTEGHVHLDLRLFLLPWKLLERVRVKERQREKRKGTPTQPAAAGGWSVVLHIDCAVTHQRRPRVLKKRPHRQGFAVHIWNWYNIFCSDLI